MKAIFEGRTDQLEYKVFNNREGMGAYSASVAAKKILDVLKEKEEVRIIFASAPSQNEFMKHLTAVEEIDWSRVVGFHMDEYIGLPEDSDQWFKNYIESHLFAKVSMKMFHFIDGTKDPEAMIEEYGLLLAENPIDLVCLGVGENGHIAFNDPPVADFDDPFPIKKVELDQFSRQQQVNDGCFETLEKVPTHALTLTIPTLLRGDMMVCTVPGATKRSAIKKVLNDPISTDCPATILRTHGNAYLVMDKGAYGDFQ
ncbi:glucosamine-6-phosphate deaminase [Sporosarcina koreensis]|uniref:glucosamine-6-phosphate deaminase n=1 Tax=Bacillales TaxID=1385 RepID=UPI00075A2676|nr:glucosamine-6-phosphate deaminase [Sporosarcina koreensis]